MLRKADGAGTFRGGVFEAHDGFDGFRRRAISYRNDLQLNIVGGSSAVSCAEGQNGSKAGRRARPRSSTIGRDGRDEVIRQLNLSVDTRTPIAVAHDGTSRGPATQISMNHE